MMVNCPECIRSMEFAQSVDMQGSGGGGIATYYCRKCKIRGTIEMHFDHYIDADGKPSPNT